MFPFKDNIPTLRFPLVTVSLVVANVAVFLYGLTLTPAQTSVFYSEYGMIPYRISGGGSWHLQGDPSVYLPLLTSMFIHAGWLHIAGNMLFLWIFGNNIEDSMGRLRFIVFYLMCGLFASFAQIAVEPLSRIPNVGASGAIAGVLGAYLLLFPRAKVTTLVFLGIFITVIELPAIIVLLFWFAFQLLSGAIGLTDAGSGDGVAYFAHIGGFVAGLLTVKIFIIGRPLAYIKRSQT